MVLSIKMSRVWSMPSKNTFAIKPIKELVDRYVEKVRAKGPDSVIIDPFANKSRIADITNDLDPEFDTDYNLDAIDFLKLFDDASVDMVFYDPPFSPRQVSECYRRLGKTVNMKTTQASYWSNQKREIGRILKPNGVVIACGWNSGGIGKVHGVEIVEILLVPHGGWHNDTIVTVGVKQEVDGD